jgi:hypothetical protein
MARRWGSVRKKKKKKKKKRAEATRLARVICVADRTSSESSVPVNLSLRRTCSIDPVIRCIIGLGRWSPLAYSFMGWPAGRSDDISAYVPAAAGRPNFPCGRHSQLPTQATSQIVMHGRGVLAPEASKKLAYPQLAPKAYVYALCRSLMLNELIAYANNRIHFVSGTMDQ